MQKITRTRINEHRSNTQLGIFMLVLYLSMSSVVAATIVWHLNREKVSLQAQTAVLDLYVAVLETESSQRGFLLTGNAVDIDEYTKSLKQVRDAQDRILSAASAFGSQPTQDLTEFNAILQNKLAEMQSTIVASHQSGSQAGINIVRNQQGLHMMNRLRVLKDSMLSGLKDN
jgi:adenylate cyclase